MNEKILKLFGKALPNQQRMSFEEVQKQSVKVGYLVHPDVCQSDVANWLLTQEFNPNATFYKTWGDVTQKSRWTLFVDQVRHYLSTYGSDFKETPFVPNATPQIVDFTVYKTIVPITVKEVISRCEKMLFSGIALQQETIEDILAVMNGLSHIPDVEKVRNREAKMFLLDRLNILPTDADEMMRFLVYKATGTTLLIKSKEVFDAVAKSDTSIATYVERFGFHKLAAVFLRHKPIFLAFKRTAVNKAVVNKLRKLAVHEHRPVGKPFIETVLSGNEPIQFLSDKVKRITNFKKVMLLQAINIRRKKTSVRAFAIRNQKLFVKENVTPPEGKNYDALYEMIYQSLVESLRAKACRIALPEGVHLTLPTSEKSFIGNFPLGTSFDMAEHDAVIGINWRGEDGANDIDLSFVDIDGKKIGWNSVFYNSTQSVVYSGDMTSANPEATELIYASKGFEPGIVKANLYNGKINAKLRVFAAKERITAMRPNYMVNPDNVLFTVETAMDSREKSFGVISEKRLILAQFRTGKGQVAGHSVTNKYTAYALQTMDCYLPLADVLRDANFIITTDQPEMDFRHLSKDTLISLMVE